MTSLETTKEFELSSSQMGLWLTQQREPDSHQYNLLHMLHWQEALDVKAFNKALRALVQRRESLRTAFIGDGVRVVQRVLAGREIRPEIHDLTCLDPKEQREWCRLETLRVFREPFRLDRDTLLRVAVFQMAPHDYAIVFVLHHIICDARSANILISDLKRLYDEAVRGGEARPDTVRQYADFVRWEQQNLSSERMEAELAFWRGRLANVPVVDFNIETPAADRDGYAGSQITLTLSADMANSLQRMARQMRTTVSNVMLSGCAILLAKYTDQTDVCVGVASANRPRAEFENTVGMFANTVVVRCDLSGNPALQEVTTRVSKAAFEAFGHAYTPLHVVLTELSPAGIGSRNGLFRVGWTFQSVPRVPHGYGDSAVNFLARADFTTTFTDLEFLVFASEQRITVQLLYATTLFESEAVRRLLRHYAAALQSVITEPTRGVRELDLMSAEELQQVTSWSKGAVDSIDRTFRCPEMISVWAEQQPDAVAIAMEDAQLTYGELESQSDQVASQLLSCGVGHERRAGFFFNRTPELLIGLIASLKANTVYAPLFDLLLNVTETEKELTGWLQYSTELYAKATAARLAEDFCRLLTLAGTLDPSSIVVDDLMAEVRAGRKGPSAELGLWSRRGIGESRRRVVTFEAEAQSLD
jgi:NRPS condensation-like uncharacterized protein